MSWIAFTLLAAFMQTWRNALQSKLSSHVSTSAVTFARFKYASPIAILYLTLLYYLDPQPIPEFSGQFWRYVLTAALMQIVATSLMVILFKQKNYAVGAGLAKSEALVAAILGTLVFGSALTILGWIGVLVGTLAIFVLSGLLKKGQFSVTTVLIGISCGASFALTSLYVREASIELGLPFLHSAGWVLSLVLLIQTVLLAFYLSIRHPQQWQMLWQYKGLTMATSITSCIGSIGWFTAMALQHVAYVKTLGQIEVLFTILLSTWWLKQPVKKTDMVGLGLISLAAVMVMWGG